MPSERDFKTTAGKGTFSFRSAVYIFHLKRIDISMSPRTLKTICHQITKMINDLIRLIVKHLSLKFNTFYLVSRSQLKCV